MWRRRHRPVPYTSVKLVETQSEAVKHAVEGGIGLVMAGRRPKTAVFRCPSGCGEVLRINLMPQMGRAWRARIDKDGRLTLTPSVDLASGCRAHFILAANTAQVILDA
jgi:hypothetical protein